MILRPERYVWTVGVIGVYVIATSVIQLLWFPLPSPWVAVVLAALALISGLTVLRLPFSASFSVGDAFSFAALFLYGVEAATVTVALDALAISLRLKRRFAQTVFNVAAPCLAMWCAGGVVFGLARLPSPVWTDDLAMALVTTAASVAIVFLVGSWLIGYAVALHEGTRIGRVWQQHFAQLWPNPVAGGYLGALMAFGIDRFGVGALVVIAPIPVILYLAFRANVGRLNDQVRHLGELNRMNQATIEAFATAVDAKDQVTHGHIRRVQSYCLALARDLGADDDATVKALEAAALLHDVGKIGIPEHILNKPGKLTVAEFEVMKRHVAIGADILSTVEFPFPVVPIVKNHHENWDGSGYPDGVKGTDIPIGARILSVVDCFDALTSDRPYRTAMSVEDASRILRERRGTMYDPRIVDSFLALQTTIPGPAGPLPAPARAATPIPARPATAELTDARIEIAQSLVDMLSVALPDNLCVAYGVDVEASSVVAVAAAGPRAAAVVGHRIPLGHGVSGWVGASRSQIFETDGELDFPDHSLSASIDDWRCSSVSLPLRTPLVLTIYGPAIPADTRTALIGRLPKLVGHLENTNPP